MKKRKGSILQRMMAVLLSAVLVTGMVSNAAPMRVLAQEPEETQESDIGNSDDTVEGDIAPGEGTEPKEPEEETKPEEPEEETKPEEPKEETKPEELKEETEPETPETVPGEITEPEMPEIVPEEVIVKETVSGNDIETETVAEPQRVMRMAAPVALAANATSGNCGENLTWKLENSVLTISGSGNMEEYSKNAPFLPPWNGNKTDIVSVVIESGVTSIGESAFFGCGSLTSIEIPSSVTSIGLSAFEGCSSLTSITIPENVTRIEWWTFYGCSSLTSITIPENVTSIGSSAFNGCSSLISITIPENVKSIEFMAFAKCSKLSKVTMQRRDDPPKLEGSVFDGCKFVTETTKGISVPEGKAQAYKDKWTAYAPYIKDDTHEHNWASDWTSNETHHWHECTFQDCTETDDTGKEGYGAHVYDNDSDTDCNTCGYERTVAHTHTLGYTASGAVITQTCSGCDLSATATLSTDKTEYSFTGNAIKPATITYSADWVGERPENTTGIVYENNTNPGTATAKLTIGEATAVLTFTIQAQTYTVTVNSGAGGGNYRVGDTVTIKANAPASGKQFDKWMVNSGNVTLADPTSSTTSFNMPAGAVSVTATYKDATGESHTHDFGDWITDQEATAAEAGTKHRDCQTCGYRETATIPATGGSSSGGDNGDAGGDNSGGDNGGNQGGDNGGSGSSDGDNGGAGGDNSGGNSGENQSGSSSAGGSGSTTSGGSGTTALGTDASGTGQPRVKQEKEGNLQKEVRVEGEAALDAAITATLPELADIVLSETEKQQAVDGTNISIVLEVKDVSAVISAADKTIVETALSGSLAKGYTLGQYLDISLYKVVGNSRSAITETNGKITVTIQVPDSLKNTNGTKTRTFAVIHVHDGKAVLLPDLDNNADTITIETDRFSTYAIVYRDTEGGNGGAVRISVENGAVQQSGGGKDNEPKTGDSTPLELCATLSMVAGMTYLLLYFTDRRRGMTEETKKELVSRIVAWAKRGAKIRTYLALAAIFVLLVYYHSIGKKTCVEWEEIYGE